MYHFTLISLMIFFIFSFFEFDIKNHKSRILGILLIIGFSFNLLKNFDRIYENDFKNNPYSMIVKKVSIQESKIS